MVSDPRASLRYFACGEYGEETNRPHYHLLIFNADFNGPTVGSSHGKPLKTSEVISECWSHPRTRESYGMHTVATADVGAVAGYIAKYALKYYRHTAGGLADADGVWKPAPFLRMSLRPAIGKEWLEKFHNDLHRGFLIHNGHKQPIPRYYKNKLRGLGADTTPLHLRSTIQQLLTIAEQQGQLQSPLNTTPSASPREGLAQQQQQQQWRHTYELLEYYQQQQQLNNIGDKHTPARRHDAELIHEQKYRNRKLRS